MTETVKPLLVQPDGNRAPNVVRVHDTSIGYGRSVISASAGKFANFLIEVDSTDYKAKTEALKACSESETAMHPGDW